MEQFLYLTRRQWTIVAVVGFGLAWLSTPGVGQAVGYSLGSIPLTYLVVLAGSRLTGGPSSDAAEV